VEEAEEDEDDREEEERDDEDDEEEEEEEDMNWEAWLTILVHTSVEMPRKSADTRLCPLASSRASSRITPPSRGCPLLSPLQSRKYPEVQDSLGWQ